MRRSAFAAALLALLTLAACGGGSTPAPTGGGGATPAASEPEGSVVAAACAQSTDAATVEIEIADFAFSPASATAKVGDVVSWTNNDSQTHSAAFDSCSTERLDNGASGALVFTEPGTYDYVCGIHPSMTATLEVTE
jgi:plastocyanin